MGIISAFLIWLLPTAIGHDIEVVWEKSVYDSVVSVFGYDMGAGDVNGDGLIDIAISWGHYEHETGWVGGVDIYLGYPYGQEANMTIWTHEEVGSGPEIVVMDINGDSIFDLVASNRGAGRAVVYFGPLEDSQTIDAWMNSYYLPTLSFGHSLANAGDVNGDGWEDLIIGSPGDRYSTVYGAAYIFFGGPEFNTGEHQPDVMLPGGLNHGPDGYEEQLGMQVGGGGDFNGDGYDDVIVAAPTYGNQEIYLCGRIYIYFGGDPMDTVEDVTFRGESAGNWLGKHTPDILRKERYAYASFGSQYWPDGEFAAPGKAYVLFGGEDYDSIPDVEIIGRTDSSNLTHGGVISVGDADHDGRDDLVIGSPTEYRYTNDEWWQGGAYFYRGGNVIDDVYDGWLEGEYDGEQPGWSLAPAGDVDGDGRSEFLVSSYASDPPVTQVWLCKFTGVGIEESPISQKELQLRLSATITGKEVRFYYDKSLNEEVTLSIYDVTGALVRRYAGIKESGIMWDLRDDLGRRVSTGAYTVRLTTDDAAATQRVIVVK